MNTPHKTIVLAAAIYEDLALRDSASRLFDQIEEAPETHFSLDFAGVRSMSRSFADEYIARRAKSKKTITECNIPGSVALMMEAVSRRSKKKGFKVDSVRTTIV
jgi:hypothetical protein